LISPGGQAPTASIRRSGARSTPRARAVNRPLTGAQWVSVANGVYDHDALVLSHEITRALDAWRAPLAAALTGGDVTAPPGTTVLTADETGVARTASRVSAGGAVPLDRDTFEAVLDVVPHAIDLPSVPLAQAADDLWPRWRQQADRRASRRPCAPPDRIDA
jgi:hypothetical protein